MNLVATSDVSAARARLQRYHDGHAYALPPTLQDAQAVKIHPDLLSSWLLYSENVYPDDPQRFLWDIRRHVSGDMAFFEEWVVPFLDAWSGENDDYTALWATADRPYEPDDRLVLESLAAIAHCAPGRGLWSLYDGGNDDLSESEREAIDNLNALFSELDCAELDTLLLTLKRPSKTTQASTQITDLQSRGIIPMAVPPQQISLDDFVAYMPTHAFIFKPTREMWPASSVDARLGSVPVLGREKPIKASAWLDLHRPVEQATWAPGESMEIKDKLVADGGWISRPGCTAFNLYRPAIIAYIAGDPSPWLDLVKWVFPEEADHIVRWLAHRVQRPWEKINHALVFGGQQGIGKDSILEAPKHAIGPWNFVEISPQQMLGRFNGHVKSVILRVSEARDLGEVDRFSFYEHSKTLMAAPPDVLRVDEKNLREHAVFNCTGVIITTNNRDALHLPADDRRHFVAWSPRTKDEAKQGYWSALYRWFEQGGTEIVADHLNRLDLSRFDPKAPPPKTAAFWSIVDASRAPEDAEMQDGLDALGMPPAVTLGMIKSRVDMGFRDWLDDRKNRRRVPFRLEACGYVPVRNADASDGLWVIGRKRQTVYAKKELAVRDQIAAAQALARPPTA